MRAAAATALALTLTLACGEPEPVPFPEVVLHLETDAPIPRTGLGPDDLTLFDRLRISVYRRGEATPCAGCVREFALASEVDRETLSFGVAAPQADDVLRVELFAERNLDRLGDPDRGSSLSAWVRLPRPAEEEVLAAYVVLAMADLGSPRGTRDAPIAAESAPRAAPLGRWSEARTTPCSASVGADEACVPGGVVWMGGAERRPGTAAGTWPRLVRVSPFVVDVHEVTVSELRESGLAVAPASSGERGDPAQDVVGVFCTYTATPGMNDTLPVTCISHALASAYCQARGKELLTEAQYEYLQGGLRGALYPWGNDEPSCADAVFGRGENRLGECGDSIGPLPVRSSVRDVVHVGGSSVHDLAGNVVEWVRDRWQDESSECTRGPYRIDPFCEGGIGSPSVARGGGFSSPRLGLRAEARGPVLDASGVADEVGFRCMRALR